ncbi:hypothetical protein Hoch_5612 [Haliangium ochraceum DSM 14365]|uniref:Lipoprotein n=1 Tax=Haliangium ochraceum (strain DSM 14365 / JCM 11303 / SMP-2) TaxID=502025 RepID=D0LG67_HALO1|nr:hypothetical protein Hoch_5612 [Haliangium ochraceum DSM 14365]
MRISPTLTTCAILLAAAGSLSACGGGGGISEPDASPVTDGGVEVDAPGEHNGICEAGGRARSDRYLPFDVGNEWRYLVDELNGEDPVQKKQEYSEVVTPDEETGEVIVQITVNVSGKTENWLQRQGDKVVRLRQRDFDQEGNLERTTLYLPSRLRLDETPENLVKGATYVDSFVREVYDPSGALTNRETNQEQWTVEDVDVPCPAPWEDVECIHYKRIRLEGGTSIKEYWFARGYGKIRETGDQIEELLGCDLN